MTNQEFNSKIEIANTISDLQKLRSETGSPKYVSLIKEKAVRIAQNESFQILTCKMSNLKNLTTETNTNTIVEVEIPKTNRAFPEYKGSKVLIYINHKSGVNFQQKADILIKKI